MDILAPHISCVVLPNELSEAIAQGYNEIYVMTPDGILKHHKLRGQNRHVRLKVDSIPGYKVEQIQQEVNFLPAGRIPIALFDQIVAFFKQVMEVKKAELEAQALICWNAEQGYHIIVPDQRVSKASVSYDWSCVPVGTNVIVDIHSHNSMNAFFSGTDDSDDREAIRFSGVVGKINQPVPDFKIRFNYKNIKLDAQFENIFEVPVRESQTPNSDWIGKVASPAATYSGKGTGRADHLRDYQFKPGQGGARQQGSFPFPKGTWTQKQEARQAQEGPEGQRLGPQFQGSGRTPSDPITDYSEFGWEGTYWGLAEGLGRDISLIEEGGVDERAEAAERALAAIKEDPEYFQKEETFAGRTFGKNPNGGALLVDLELIDSERYDELVCNHGAQVASAFCAIDEDMSFLQGKDDLLKDLMRDMVHLMSDDGQVAFFRDLFFELPSTEQVKIQTNGF